MTTARTTDMTGDHALDNYFCLADGRVSAYSTEPSTTTMDTIIVICEFPILYLCRVHLMRRRPRITKVPRSEHCARTWSPFLSGFYHGIACSHHYVSKWGSIWGLSRRKPRWHVQNGISINFYSHISSWCFTIIAIELDGWLSDGGAGVVVGEICKNVTTTGHHP